MVFVSKRAITSGRQENRQEWQTRSLLFSFRRLEQRRSKDFSVNFRQIACCGLISCIFCKSMAAKPSILFFLFLVLLLGSWVSAKADCEFDSLYALNSEVEVCSESQAIFDIYVESAGSPPASLTLKIYKETQLIYQYSGFAEIMSLQVPITDSGALCESIEETYTLAAFCEGDSLEIENNMLTVRRYPDLESILAEATPSSVSCSIDLDMPDCDELMVSYVNPNGITVVGSSFVAAFGEGDIPFTISNNSLASNHNCYAATAVLPYDCACPYAPNEVSASIADVEVCGGDPIVLEAVLDLPSSAWSEFEIVFTSEDDFPMDTVLNESTNFQYFAGEFESFPFDCFPRVIEFNYYARCGGVVMATKTGKITIHPEEIDPAFVLTVLGSGTESTSILINEFCINNLEIQGPATQTVGSCQPEGDHYYEIVYMDNEGNRPDCGPEPIFMEVPHVGGVYPSIGDFSTVLDQHICQGDSIGFQTFGPEVEISWLEIGSGQLSPGNSFSPDLSELEVGCEAEELRFVYLFTCDGELHVSDTISLFVHPNDFRLSNYVEVMEENCSTSVEVLECQDQILVVGEATQQGITGDVHEYTLIYQSGALNCMTSTVDSIVRTVQCCPEVFVRLKADTETTLEGPAVLICELADPQAEVESFYWYHTAALDTLLTGHTDAQYYVIDQAAGDPLELEDYRVLVTYAGNYAGCSQVGIAAKLDRETTELSLYPNPSADGRFTLQLVESRSSQTLAFQVFNQAGRLVRQAELLVEQEVELDLSQLPPGLYCLEAVLSSGQRFARKLLII